ncbi:TRAP transporter substrate-binding protein DctP [Dethiosulfatarculus sandiegensis]|uniref:C4-dicarboxylate ABC transporter substrate-binding protein n=1 Tax=Dethiosulfatarculus sandiegensis TaxID=1429043 RepID=A0A0D2K1S0_9BACT|nr:TRAP transporter substrate-binding protein DctP [Dethiosulfatarculus sandiegensis]KIX15630.1 C4-dicarboxylate ABC transporter substrate-binding protein [Dethiosulfatarculus sandiegensis]
MRKLLAIAAAVAISITMLASLALAADYEWRFALEEIEGSIQHEYAKKFKEVIEKKSGGKVKLDFYFYGQIGNNNQVSELLQDGALTMAFQSPGHLGSYIPEVNIFNLHYLLPDNREVNKAILMGGENTYAALAPYYAKKNLMLLSIIPEGWQVWSLKKEVRKPEDFNGMKFRVMTSPMLVEAYKAYGANPTPMPYSEIYSALQLKMIEGQVQPYFAHQEMKFYEVTDYFVNAKQLMYVTTLCFNKDKFDSLSPEMQKMVRESVDEATAWLFKFEEEFNAKRLAMIKKAKPEMKVVNLTPDEIAAFRAKAKDVEKVYLEIGGDGAPEVLKAVRKDIKENTGK